MDLPSRSAERAAAGLSGALLGVGIGLPAAHGVFAVLPIALVGSVLCAGLLRALVPTSERRVLGVFLVLAVSLRLAVAAVVFFGSIAAGSGGFIVGDDRAYASLASNYLLYLRGEPQPPFVPPLWAGDAYLFGTFVYLETALFAVFGPQLLAMTSLNAVTSGLFVVLMYDLGRRIIGTRPALLTAAVLTVYPSLVLWSALNLKDALALFLITTVIAIVCAFTSRPGLLMLAAFVLAIVPLAGLRQYVFLGLCLVFAVSTSAALLPQAAKALRAGGAASAAARALGWTAAAIVTAAAMVFVLTPRNAPGIPTGGLRGLEGLEQQRTEMGVGARTSFVDPKTIAVARGDTFRIVDPEASAGPVSSRPPRVIVVSPDARIVLEAPAGQLTPSPSTRSGSKEPPVVYVRPGDIVVVGSAGAAPRADPVDLPLRHRVAGDTTRFVDSNTAPEALVLTRTLAHIPRGLLYGMLAPFPWDLDRVIEAVTIPEMIFWYLVLVALPFALWGARAHWQAWLPLFLFVGGIVMVFALVEGNYGTIFRHRAMIIPFVVLLASPALTEAWDRLSAYARRRSARSMSYRDSIRSTNVDTS